MVGTCTSWLLDPQLAEYLPAGSNLVRFQRRFELVPGLRIDNESIVSFLRSGPGVAPEQPPRETALQRAVCPNSTRLASSVRGVPALAEGLTEAAFS